MQLGNVVAIVSGSFQLNHGEMEGMSWNNRKSNFRRSESFENHHCPNSATLMRIFLSRITTHPERYLFSASSVRFPGKIKSKVSPMEAFIRPAKGFAVFDNAGQISAGKIFPLPRRNEMCEGSFPLKRSLHHPRLSLSSRSCI